MVIAGSLASAAAAADIGPIQASPWQPAKVSTLPVNTRTDPEVAAFDEPVNAFVLDSEDSRFGGFSAAAWLNNRLYLLSDRATIWRCQAKRDQHGGLTGFSDWEMANVFGPGRSGSPDLEAMVVDNFSESEESQGAAIWVAAEGHDEIFGLKAGEKSFVLEREGLPRLGLSEVRNQGIEALARTAAGSWLALSEGMIREGGGHVMVEVQSDHGMRTTAWPTASGFAPTDAVVVDDQLYVLERRYGLLAGWQANIAAATLPLGTNPIDRRVLKQLRTGIPLDNFEGLAVRRVGTGLKALVVSDDNFFGLQKTILLEFNLTDQASVD